MRPIDEVLSKGNLTIDQLNNIEILGGAVRVPRVQSIV